MSMTISTGLQRGVDLTNRRSPAPSPLTLQPARRARRTRRAVRLLWTALLFSPYVLLPLMPLLAMTLWMIGIG